MGVGWGVGRGRKALEANKLSLLEGDRIERTALGSLTDAVLKPSGWLSEVMLGGGAAIGHAADHTCPHPSSDLTLFCKYLVLTSHAAPPWHPQATCPVEGGSRNGYGGWSLCNVLVIFFFPFPLYAP